MREKQKTKRAEARLRFFSLFVKKIDKTLRRKVTEGEKKRMIHLICCEKLSKTELAKKKMAMLMWGQWLIMAKAEGSSWG